MQILPHFSAHQCRQWLAIGLAGGLLVVSLLAGCRYVFSVSSSGSNDTNGFFFSFRISSDEQNASIPQIDPAINDGRFDLHFLFEHTDRYEITLFLGRESRLNANDLLVSAFICGQNGALCSSALEVPCFFRSAMTVQCAGDTATDVGPFFTQLPQQGYILARACRLGSVSSPLPSDSSCVNSSFLVEFR